jgi:DNA integrity scanning protein DisA with diadenylate cyclase activity
MDDYFISTKLLSVIDEKLDRRVANMDMSLLLVDQSDKFDAFVQDYRDAQATTIGLIQETIHSALDLKLMNFFNLIM